MKQVLKKFFSIAMAALIVISQTPLGVLVGTVPQASAAITTVSVTAPTGGAVSNSINIGWTTNVDPENVDISYCQGSNCAIENFSLTPITLNESNDGTYSWDTSSIPNGTGYKIVIARAGFQAPLGLSAAFEIYNADYDDTERRDILGIGFPDPSPIWANQATYLTTYITNTITRSSFAWTQQSGPGTISFSSTTGDTTTVSADQDGSYIIRFTATDYAGNTVYDDLTFNRDTTAPTSDDDVQAGWYNGSAYITFSCDDGTGTGCNKVRYSLNGAPTPGVSNYVTIEGSTGSVWINDIGVHTLWYMAEDNLGNVATAQSGENLLRIEYDYDDPDYWDYVDIYDDEYRNSQFEKSASVDVPTGVLSGAWSRIGGAGTGVVSFSATGSNPTDIEATEDGVYEIEYEVTTNGNQTYSDSFTLYRDTTAPTSSDNAPVGRQALNSSIDFDCSDNVSGCDRLYYRIDDGEGFGNWDYLDRDTTDDLYFSEYGQYTIEYYAVDKAGNIEDNEGYNSTTLRINDIDSEDFYVDAGESVYESSEFMTDSYVNAGLAGVASYLWTYSGPGTITFGSDTGSDTTISASVDGIYTITLTATGNAGYSDSDSFTLYRDTSVPTIENLNVTVESYDTIHIAGLASNTNGLSPIDRVFYYIDYEDAGNGFLTLTEENATTTTFYDDIDITHLANGTYTLYVRATTQSEVTSEWMSQSFTKTSSPAQTTPPAFVSSTPNNAATHVSVAEGTATVIFDENIELSQTEGNYITIKKVSNGQEVLDGEGAFRAGAVIYIPYVDLEYNTNYVIVIPAGSVVDIDENPTTTDINIYFTTQVGTAPDIEGLWVDYVGATDATIYANVEPSPDTHEYRISTTAYNGERYELSQNEGPFYANLTELTTNTTYYYQVRFVHDGHTVVSVPMSFKTAAAANGIVVNSIARVLNNVDPVIGGNYSNGYHFRFYLTINALWEDRLEFRLANWSRIDGGTMAVANNTKVIVSEQGTSDYNATGTTLINTGYTTIGDVWDMDADQNLGGRQLYLDLFYKIPTGSQGVYTTSFGIQSSSRCIGNEGGPTLLEGGVWQTAC